MTTSHELSLQLKELGVEQENGEYYWCEHTFTKKILLARKEPRGLSFSAICRAFTLGELVRMLPYFAVSRIPNDFHFTSYKHHFHNTSPEEAAAELVIELVKSGVIKFEPPVAPNEKDFAQWITEDALPTTKDILAELREINRKRDEAKSWLTENNIDITEEATGELLAEIKSQEKQKA